MSNQTRRSFIKTSSAKSLLAVNAGAVLGLINTPGTSLGATTITTGGVTSSYSNDDLISITKNYSSPVVVPSPSGTTYPTEEAALAAGKLARRNYLDDNTGSEVSRNEGPTTGMVPVYKITPSTSSAPVSVGGSSGAYTYEITFPSGSVTYTFWEAAPIE